MMNQSARETFRFTEQLVGRTALRDFFHPDDNFVFAGISLIMTGGSFPRKRMRLVYGDKVPLDPDERRAEDYTLCMGVGETQRWFGLFKGTTYGIGLFSAIHGSSR